MSTNHTPNFNLCQWEATDKVLRSDFNADNQKIDAALSALPRLILGTYTGDGKANQFISLERTPKAVLSMQSNGYLSQQYQTVFFGGLALEGCPIEGGGAAVIAIEENGFRVYENANKDVHANTLDAVYHYLAVL